VWYPPSPLPPLLPPSLVSTSTPSGLPLERERIRSHRVSELGVFLQRHRLTKMSEGHFSVSSEIDMLSRPVLQT